MHPPIFVRTLSDDETASVHRALRSSVALTCRRAQILRLSAERKTPPEIADALGCARQTVRNAIHDFETRGLDALTPQKSGPKAPPRLLDEAARARLLDLVRQSPRAFDKPRSTWTLPLLAEVAFEQGLTERQVSHETIRQAMLALGHSWQRAKKWIRSPDPLYDIKKGSATA